MPSQPPKTPTPADLVRLRPRPAPPPPHRQAEREKERTLLALRALVDGPGTQFAALPADEFFAALKCACADGATNPALIADATRRIISGEAGPRELHQVLFAARDHRAWAQARELAMAAAVRVPAMAVAVVELEAQRLRAAGMQVAESAVADGFAARAWLDRDGARVEGKAGYGSSKKAARQAAALSLLAALTGLAIPDAEPPAARQAAPVASELTAAELESWLDYEVGRPSPDPEFAGAIKPGRLSARSVYLLLFEADPRGWADARAAAWEALVSAPSLAGGVLSMYSQTRSWPPVVYVATTERSAVAFLPTPDGLVVGEPVAGASPKAARAGTALALLRDLAPPAPHAPVNPDGSSADRNPVSVLNERVQTGAITDLSYEQDAEGPAHQPMFTCTMSCADATGTQRYVAAGRSKNEAKAAAAAGLLEQLTKAERSAAAALARAAEAEARSPQGIFGRLLKAGCALDFQMDAPAFRLSYPAGGELPEPLAGWTVPLLTALPGLAGHAVSAAPLHASARAWAAAVRAALAAVAARRVYPALDEEGRDCWRLTLDPDALHGLAPDAGTRDAGSADADAAAPGLAGFLDAVADALLRPPGARLVIGDKPYAGRPRVLAGAAAEWADHAAEMADPAPAKPPSVRISPPATDGAPLRAELRAPRLGHAEHRLLRCAAREWPPLARIRRDGTLGGEEAVQLLGPAGERLASLGITIEWAAELAGGSGLGARAVAVPRPQGTAGAFSLGEFADLSWQLTLDGEPLSEQEADAVAAADGVARLRGRWVLINPDVARRARERSAGQLTGAQALSAALTGQITIGGQDVACTATGRLADLVAALRASVGAGVAHGIDMPDGLRANLRGYQQRAVQWLVRTTGLGFGALLADDMGLGKTLTAIAFHLARQRGAAGPALVVCPASLLANWEREFARFAPDVPVRRYHGASRSLDDLSAGDVVVTTYQTLLRDASRLAEVRWDTLVADEAQQVKNHRSQAACTLRSLPSAARIAVTGTPVENSLSELWAILDWVNPGLFGTLPTFRERYGRAAEREADGDAARRLGRLISPFVLRRRKTDPDVAPELPDKVVSDSYAPLTTEQAALYRAATADTLKRIAASAGIARRGQVLRLLQSLRQICNSPAHFLREPADSWDADAQAARSGKLQALDELMESVAAAGDAALIFTGYVSMGHLIQAHLRARRMPVEFVHGGVAVARRQEIVDRFQSGDSAALILSVRAAGTGLNLTRASHVIHFDRPWNPAVEDQATDRAHRIGQHRCVNVHHLIAEGTVEDRIAELLARKRGLTEAVLAGGERALTELDDGELRALVSLSQDGGDA
ncbi:MAG TPA: SNF2-related protein [Streptosporangiaceae bacterium]|nr:SNF2-related protein [Streptosporangiaceae bacterium]